MPTAVPGRALQSLSWQVQVHGVPGPDLLTRCARHELALNVFAFGRAAERAGLREGIVYMVRLDDSIGRAGLFGQAAFESYAGRWLAKISATRPAQTPRTITAD